MQQILRCTSLLEDLSHNQETPMSSNLTYQEVKLLKKLPVSQSERLYLEHLWTSEEYQSIRKPLTTTYQFLLTLVLMLLIAGAYGVTLAGISEPISNLAVIVQWVVMLLLALVTAASFSTLTKENSSQKLSAVLLAPHMVASLAPIGVVRRLVGAVVTVSLVVLPGLLGHHLTAFVMCVVWIAAFMNKKAVQEVVPKHLAGAASHMYSSTPDNGRTVEGEIVSR